MPLRRFLLMLPASAKNGGSLLVIKQMYPWKCIFFMAKKNRIFST